MDDRGRRGRWHLRRRPLFGSLDFGQDFQPGQLRYPGKVGSFVDCLEDDDELGIACPKRRGERGLL